jgi:type II secretory pathway pseudopilin PulG
VAVAVIAIGLLVVIGLFPQGLQSARDAADNTMAATIVQDLFSQLRSGNFNGIVQICTDPLQPGDVGYPGCKPGGMVLLYLSSANSQFLTFDQDGFITKAVSPYLAYYRVRLQWQQQNPGLLLVWATISWPALTSASPPNSSVYVTQIAWYNNP